MCGVSIMEYHITYNLIFLGWYIKVNVPVREDLSVVFSHINYVALYDDVHMSG